METDPVGTFTDSLSPGWRKPPGEFVFAASAEVLDAPGWSKLHLIGRQGLVSDRPSDILDVPPKVGCIHNTRPFERGNSWADSSSTQGFA